MVIAEFGTGQVFWSMLYFSLFFMWIYLVIALFSDIFRSEDLSGWGKAAWSLLIIILPFIGILAYLIARGGKMNERALDDAHARETAFRSYVQEVATPSDVDQLTKLASLRADGLIDDAEFQRMKSRLTPA